MEILNPWTFGQKTMDFMVFSVFQWFPVVFQVKSADFTKIHRNPRIFGILQS